MSKSIYPCSLCTASFVSNYNLRRHSILHHGTEAGARATDEYKCPQCLKAFDSEGFLNKHLATGCRNIQPTVCEFCHQTFQHPRSRYKHYKTCVGVEAGIGIREIGATEGVSQSDSRSLSSFVSDTGSYSDVPESIYVSVPVILYDHTGTGSAPLFLKDAIVHEEFVKRLLHSIRTTRLDRTIVVLYMKELYVNRMNRCIRKPLMETSYSEVHTGDHCWEARLDKVLYPKLVTDLSNDFSEYIYKQRCLIPNSLFSRIIEFLDYMAVDGYINTDNKEKRGFIKNEYLLLVKELKLVIHNMTHDRSRSHSQSKMKGK